MSGIGLVPAVVLALTEFLDLLGKRVHLAAALPEEELEDTLELGLELLRGLPNPAHEVHDLRVLHLLALVDLGDVVSEPLKFFGELAAEFLGKGDALGKLITLGVGASDELARLSREVDEAVYLVETLGDAAGPFQDEAYLGVQ